jgi:hypothetical protein
MKTKIEKLNITPADIVVATVPKGANVKAVHTELRKLCPGQRILVMNGEVALGTLGELLAVDDIVRMMGTHPSKFAAALIMREEMLAAKSL